LAQYSCVWSMDYLSLGYSGDDALIFANRWRTQIKPHKYLCLNISRHYSYRNNLRQTMIIIEQCCVVVVIFDEHPDISTTISTL